MIPYIEGTGYRGSIPGRRIVALVALVAGSLGPALGARPALGEGVKVLSIDGRGFGHGVGMPQDGALALAKSKATLEQIMARFYPGTGWGKAGGAVRIGVAEAGAATGRFTLTFPAGGELRDGRDGSSASPFPLRFGKGGSAVVTFDGNRYRAQIAATGAALDGRGRHGRTRKAVSQRWKLVATDQPTTTTLPSLLPTTSTVPIGAPATSSPTTTATTTATTRTTATSGTARPGEAAATSSAPLWAVPAAGGTVIVAERGREYRGLVEAIAANGGYRIVNEVDVEDYLRGMGEVRNPGWPAAGLEAQTVAARTYALRAARSGQRPEGFSLFDDDRSQVYLGRPAEFPAMDKAVNKTRGRVLTFGGSLAATVYSASAGGITATAPEGFGPKAPDRPYLGVTRYDTADQQAWHIDIALSDVATRLAYPGIPTVVAVSARGPSGRATEVTLEGPGGTASVDGATFAARLGLRSTLFDVGFATAQVAPPPPPPSTLQQLPEGGAVVGGEVAGAALPSGMRPLPRLLASAPSYIARPAPGRHGPLPPTAALVLLLIVTWALLAHRSPEVATATAHFARIVRRTGTSAYTAVRDRARRKRPPFRV